MRISLVGRQQRQGQAAIEFVAAIFLIMLIILGLTHLAKLSSHTIELCALVREKGGMLALQGGFAKTPRFISDWTDGPDGKIGTADDQPKSSSINSLNAILSAGSSNYTIADQSALDFTPATVYQKNDVALGIGLIHHEKQVDVEIDSFIQQTVYDKASIKLRQEFWMPNLELMP